MTSLLETEIHEQPQAFARLLDTEQANVAQLAARLKALDISYVTIAARGTSDNAGIYAKYLFASALGLPVAMATPSLYTLYKRPPRLRNTLVIGISQSGESIDILAVLEEARRQGAPTLAIVNVEGSSMARAAEHVIPLHAGTEKAVAATKSYTTSLGALAMLAVAMGGEGLAEADLQAMPGHIAAALKTDAAATAIAEGLREIDDVVVVGRGFNYCSAYELSIKMKELTYTHAEPYSSADFLHGPIAILDERYRVIAIAPSGPLQANQIEFIQRAQARGGKVIAISDNAEVLAAAGERLVLPAGMPEWTSPIAAIVPGQLLALRLTEARGYSTDAPRGLTKVTKTL